MKRPVKFCDGVRRRDFLHVGAASLFGLPLTLPGLLARQAAAAQAGANVRNDVSIVYLFLKGGLSTIDTFDLKPDAPEDIRGEFNPIASRVPGVQVAEHIPRIAGQLDKLSLIRSFTHSNSNHGHADHYMMTGYHPTAAFNAGLSPNNQRPSFGSVVAHTLGPRGSVPPYVCVPGMHPSAGSAYLGATAAPFVIEGDPSAVGFAVPDLAPPLSLSSDRLADRQRMLATVDRYQQTAASAANAPARMVSVFQQKAFELMTSPEAKVAFDIHAEPDKLRDAYGRTSLGQSCLMARRLVEAGVRFVSVEHANWDTHDDNFGTLKNTLLPQLDAALSTLLSDLADRGLLERTIVLVTGEFGRTPRINKNAGRDHWGPCFTVAIAGGGIVGGRVIGRSDPWAQKPAENPHGPEELAATIYYLLGVDPAREFLTPEGRPVALVNGGRPVRELL